MSLIKLTGSEEPSNKNKDIEEVVLDKDGKPVEYKKESPFDP